MVQRGKDILDQNTGLIAVIGRQKFAAVSGQDHFELKFIKHKDEESQPGHDDVSGQHGGKDAQAVHTYKQGDDPQGLHRGFDNDPARESSHRSGDDQTDLQRDQIRKQKIQEAGDADVPKAFRPGNRLALVKIHLPPVVHPGKSFDRKDCGQERHQHPAEYGIITHHSRDSFPERGETLCGCEAAASRRSFQVLKNV